ncbi:DUF397 domain-containing protein [Actinomadura sp. GC306]|uniref:DUF397 domain-containing protein n=1 Tax=Actinomadura sp. GC306 TaxID=2530367 RepID=UPI001052CF8C|nr:DUF397 domain-containing protein [Actinomadura sp. GC306]TDC68228.1 DUF397 domain-containing protein [Actinomadura sp. GC306]
MTVLWRKSSHSSDGTTSQCVEVARLGCFVGVRDSQRPGHGHIMLTREGFNVLIQEIKDAGP